MGSVNNFVYLGKIIWLYTKYQMLTKLLLAFSIYPIFKLLISTLIQSTGRFSISSGDYIQFLFSFQGLGLLIIVLVFLLLLISFDINSFIIMSALIKENRINLTARQLLITGIKSLKPFLNPSGLIVALYVAIVIPLVGVGLSVSVMKDFKIPNFITDVIFNNPIYYVLYTSIVILLMIMTLYYIFFFHFLLIDNNSIGQSLKRSSQLMKRHWKEFIRKFIIQFGFLYISAVIVSAGILYFLLFLIQELDNTFLKRFVSILTALSGAELSTYFALMTVSFACYVLTDLFYLFNKKMVIVLD